MPRGGHKGGLFPVSGIKWGMHERVKKRGLYHNRREDILTPRWGYRYENRNKKYLPDGSSKSFDYDVTKAWPQERKQWNYYYTINEGRYIWPSICAHNPDIKNYILNVLEDSQNRPFSGIGFDEVQNDYIKDQANSNNDNSLNNMNSNNKNSYLYKLATEFNNTIYPQIEVNLNNRLKRGRIQKLYDIIKEENIWKTTQKIKTAQTENVFPYVDDNATLIRELPLSEILYTKNNLRLKVRRHPKWMNVQFLKKKLKIPYLYRRRVSREELQKKELGSFF
ncbi:conserved Plasmodium protein, unknown function [Plasmodium chabaudi chabaudi]|uniref:Uncharacterized protein n=2 Tax=Plasmodium chabaudi TaxID=5825 RepID=A0A077TLJ8_PLACU|nr:conserved protein, unknown function [Plasmodium chabaudi chabaudi]SCM22504.1 conserved Plasmodium protein, unknown function [Plasmodium chabaudi adami]SCN61201.1 conserved Plasmodium protein, unknown function [Plasmodium chabaudi adami]SCN61202.1 conserved Plasmodium protein, unknown function [Plasmodium chabaudi chabaudi]VTZ69220.1 conserved protein, unknown function [Plasmodium chabaudi chabaudi]|eukprot:XP_016653993.1 conserved Plasmodium protein, unknown function [Plasmodium chabaudi chabaudi]